VDLSVYSGLYHILSISIYSSLLHTRGQITGKQLYGNCSLFFLLSLITSLHIGLL